MYINDNFLHAPSTDLSRETVKLLSNIMLAQAQECVCQTQIREGKTGKIVAKLANQAAMLFGAVIEGVNEQISAGVFERVWASLIFVIPFVVKRPLIPGQAKIFLISRTVSSCFGRHSSRRTRSCTLAINHRRIHCSRSPKNNRISRGLHHYPPQ